MLDIFTITLKRSGCQRLPTLCVHGANQICCQHRIFVVFTINNKTIKHYNRNGCDWPNNKNLSNHGQFLCISDCLRKKTPSEWRNLSILSYYFTQNTKSAYFCLPLEKMCRCLSYINNLLLNYICLVNNGEESEMVISNQSMFSLYTRNFKRRVTSFHGRICRSPPFLAQHHPSNVTSNTSLISTQQLEIQIFVSQGNPSTVND